MILTRTIRTTTSKTTIATKKEPQKDIYWPKTKQNMNSYNSSQITPSEEEGQIVNNSRKAFWQESWQVDHFLYYSILLPEVNTSQRKCTIVVYDWVSSHCTVMLSILVEYGGGGKLCLY